MSLAWSQQEFQHRAGSTEQLAFYLHSSPCPLPMRFSPLRVLGILFSSSILLHFSGSQKNLPGSSFIELPRWQLREATGSFGNNRKKKIIRLSSLEAEFIFHNQTWSVDDSQLIWTRQMSSMLFKNFLTSYLGWEHLNWKKGVRNSWWGQDSRIFMKLQLQEEKLSEKYTNLTAHPIQPFLWLREFHIV